MSEENKENEEKNWEEEPERGSEDVREIPKWTSNNRRDAIWQIMKKQCKVRIL